MATCHSGCFRNLRARTPTPLNLVLGRNVMSSDTIRYRLEALLEEGSRLRHGGDRDACTDSEHFQNCKGWVTGIRSFLRVLFPNGDSIYTQEIDELAKQDWGWTVNQLVGEIYAILKHLSTDINSGLLSSIEDQTRIQIFDNFLDHARHYLDDNKKNEAGVIAGVVFEDTIRRIADKSSVPQAGVKLDQVISALSQSQSISGAMAKRARAAAHVRTKATHAQWDEFEVGDVAAAISTTDELVLKLEQPAA